MSMSQNIDMSMIYPYANEEGQAVIPGIPVADIQALQQWSNPRDRIDLINSSAHMYFPLAQGASSTRVANGGGLPIDAEVHLKTSEDMNTYVPDIHFYNQVGNVEDLPNEAGKSRGRVIATVKGRKGVAQPGYGADLSMGNSKAVKTPRGGPGRKGNAKGVDSDEEDEDEEETDEQRKRHRESETRRRGRLRDQFQVLSDLVQCPKKTRAQILVCAVSQLQEFQNKVQELEARLQASAADSRSQHLNSLQQPVGLTPQSVVNQNMLQNNMMQPNMMTQPAMPQAIMPSQTQNRAFQAPYPPQPQGYPTYPAQSFSELNARQNAMRMQNGIAAHTPIPLSASSSASSTSSGFMNSVQPADIGGVTGDSRRGIGRFEGHFSHLAALADVGLDDDVDSAGTITPNGQSGVMGSITPDTQSCSSLSENGAQGPSPHSLMHRSLSAQPHMPGPYAHPHSHVSVAMDDVYPAPANPVPLPMAHGAGSAQQYTLASLTRQAGIYANTPPVQATLASHVPVPLPLAAPAKFNSPAFPSLSDTPTAGPMRAPRNLSISSCSNSNSCSGTCLPEQERPLFLSNHTTSETPNSPSNPIVRSVVGALQRQLAPLVAEDSFVRPPCMPADSNPSDLPPCMRGDQHHPLHVKTCMMTGRPAATPALISIHHELLSNVAICLISLDGKFLDCNSEFVRNMGGSRSDILSTTIFDKTHPDDVPKLVRMFKLMLEGKVGVWESNRRCIVDSGIVVNHFTLSTVKVAQHPLFFVGFCLPREISRTPADVDAIESQLNSFPFGMNDNPITSTRPNPRDFVNPYEQDEPPKKCIYYSPPENVSEARVDTPVMAPPSATDILTDE